MRDYKACLFFRMGVKLGISQAGGFPEQVYENISTYTAQSDSRMEITAT